MSRTARELSTEELRTYRPWARISAWSADPGLEDRRRRAWSAAREAAELLRSRYGARRVLAFGSLVTPDRFTPWSDIDLAVEGVAPAWATLGDRPIILDPRDAARPAPERGTGERLGTGQ